MSKSVIDPPENDDDFVRWYIGLSSVSLFAFVDRIAGSLDGKLASADTAGIEAALSKSRARYQSILNNLKG